MVEHSQSPRSSGCDIHYVSLWHWWFDTVGTTLQDKLQPQRPSSRGRKSKKNFLGLRTGSSVSKTEKNWFSTLRHKVAWKSLKLQKYWIVFTYLAFRKYLYWWQDGICPGKGGLKFQWVVYWQGQEIWLFCSRERFGTFWWQCDQIQNKAKFNGHGRISCFFQSLLSSVDMKNKTISEYFFFVL